MWNWDVRTISPHPDIGGGLAAKLLVGSSGIAIVRQLVAYGTSDENFPHRAAWRTLDTDRHASIEAPMNLSLGILHDAAILGATEA